jgi:lipid A 3-O-deacylase
LVTVSGASADSVSTGYDIRLLMGKMHPFATRSQDRWDQNRAQPAQPAAQPAARPTFRQPAAQPIAQPVYAPAPVRPAPRRAVQPVSAPAPQQMPAASTKTGPLWPGGTERGARASSRGKPLGGIISEISIGALVHDEGPFSNSKEDGYDGHIEVRFASPRFLDIIWSPEPHIGANINTEGDTSQVFAGLSYEWNLWKGLFAGISVGGALHDGETDSGALDKKDLGCHLLFRESLTLGWELTEHHKIAAIFDHISNAKICSHNEGLENLGVRYSYRF